MKRIYLLFTLALFISANAQNTQKIIINEFLALNSNSITDEDGDNSDWLELYNPTAEAVNLEGWSLTDTEGNPKEWVFPAVTIGPEEYLIVFASNKDRAVAGKELHTNFALSGAGEYLAIIEPDGTVSDEFTPFFPAQQTDISYGLYQGEYVYFSIPTPGSENLLEGQILSPVFSAKRGYYDTAFEVALSVTDPDTKIYYTTDGTIPTAQSALYSSPITISTTTPLSAISIKDGTPSPVVTHTYLFIKDIINQPDNPEGYPDRWGYLNYAVGSYKAGERAPADYEMDPEVVSAAEYKDYLADAFLAIPSVSVVTTPGYIFSDSTDENEGGIYIYTGDSGNPSSNGGNKLGAEWERPASVEFYEPATGKQFQINCGLRLHGGNSRKPYNSEKHSFRISFRKEYGSGKLNFKLFDEKSAAVKFDHLVLRAGYNYSWVKNNDNERLNAQYIYDSFAKKAQLNMGHIAAHDRFVHLFINGLYWGLYDISEKLNDNFMEAYLGGKDSDYDVINDDGLVDGSLAAYNTMLSLAKSGKYNELLSQKLLEPENFIDYMLINFYIGNNDWGKNNWFAGRNAVEPEYGFMFFSWDAENCMTDVNSNKITEFEGPLREMLFGSSSGSTSGGLFANATFKALFQERVNLHFTNNGILTPSKAAELYEQLAGEIDLPIILESARWGDYRKDTLPHNNTLILYTRNNHWLPRKEALLVNYFPYRTAVVLEQLKNLGITVGIHTPETASAHIYYHNNTLYYTLPAEGEASIDIYAVDGKKVQSIQSGSLSAGNHQSDITHIPQGVYIYKFKTGDASYSGKFVK